MASDKTEKNRYTLISASDEVEIRLYKPMTLATVYSRANTYRELAYPGFRKLAGYIFGGNDSEIKIPMTSPVQMDISDSTSSMSFIIPEEYTLDNPPKPDDPEVTIHKRMEEYVAAIKFGGFASDKDIEIYSGKLKNILKSKGIYYSGNFRFLGYDPPFRLIGRRNEIIVSVVWEETSKL